MERVITVYGLNSSNNRNLTFVEPDECPICKSRIAGKILFGIYESDYVRYSLDFCSACKGVFLATHNSSGEVISCEPNRFVEKTFTDELTALSPQFVKIYNQASAAESSSLDEIAGIGYRKALEFLIKDFAISQNSDDADKIKNMRLSPCINEYIDNTKIKQLAIKSAWLGNDETHYVRKFEDRDINDMKKFIDALVYFISMDLIVSDAESLTS
ncbi:MAG: DUF4145 domain-containing protein [Clostridia bacterium]|nr:DUF4145 domain-containing protein [Clostridia bacterium]